MNKDQIHFAHANGFPAKTYSKLFSFLADDFEIGYLERHGHNPKFPVSDGWESLKDELKAEIEKRYTKPIIGLGHSFGGILHLLVSVENPEFYKQIILLDAPIVSRSSSYGVRVLKFMKLMDRFSHSKITRFRRNHWQSKEEALLHFKQKPAFAAFDEDVLRDYIEHGIVRGEKGFELFFSRETEARIYRTLPHHLPRLKGKLKVPTAYIGGKTSREAELARLSFMQKHFPIDFYFLEGSHLFPFEIPAQTAEKIKEILSKSKNSKVKN